MNDKNLIFSDKQAITATAPSENVIKIDASKEVGFGTPVDLLIQVTEDFNNCTSVTAAVETAADENFTTPVTLVQTAPVPLADLKTGYKFNPITFPKGNLGFVRIKYTVAGTAPTKGKIFAAIVDGIENSYHN